MGDEGERAMAEGQMTRRLAAILAADVVGYSRLMGEDEAGTMSAIRSIWTDLFRPKIDRHHGRVVRIIGDGALAEFGSVVDAVECAVGIQRAMIERNARGMERRPIEFRIGVNLGDIIIEGDDIYGDGVNIAARLEAEAPCGGVLTSDVVHAEVTGKVGVTFIEVGEVSFKNIDRPLRVWRWESGLDVAMTGDGDDKDAQMETSIPPAAPRLQGKPSIAVLPFANMSADAEQEYFSDGITEDIITDLARFRSLVVIARNSTFTFKGQSVDVSEVGRKLGARYVVEGSVRRAGKRVRVTVQLIEAEGGSHIWADRYDRDLEDIFAVQDEVTRNIVSMVVGRVEMDSLQRAKHKPTQNMAAYDYLLQGVQRFNEYTREENAAAQKLFKLAAELDPDFALAYAYLASTYLHDWFWEISTEPMDQLAHAYANKALALDDQESRCHMVLGRVELHRKNFGPAILHHQRCVAQNPNDADVAANMGMLLAFTGKPEEAIQWIESAMRLNPYHPDWYREDLGQSYYVARRYQEAVGVFNQIPSPPLWVRGWLAACYGQLDWEADAAKLRDELQTEAPDLDWDAFARKEPFQHAADMDHILEGLAKAGLLPAD